AQLAPGRGGGGQDERECVGRPLLDPDLHPGGELEAQLTLNRAAGIGQEPLLEVGILPAAVDELRLQLLLLHEAVQRRIRLGCLLCLRHCRSPWEGGSGTSGGSPPRQSVPVQSSHDPASPKANGMDAARRLCLLLSFRIDCGRVSVCPKTTAVYTRSCAI